MRASDTRAVDDHEAQVVLAVRDRRRRRRRARVCVRSGYAERRHAAAAVAQAVARDVHQIGDDGRRGRHHAGAGADVHARPERLALHDEMALSAPLTSASRWRRGTMRRVHARLDRRRRRRLAMASGLIA